MRLALSLASVLVLGSAAFAEEPKSADAPPAAAAAPAAVAKKTPLRVVRVLPETQQALLFDKAKGTHVLAEVGKQVDGFTVVEIDEDTVTLAAIEGGGQVVLAGPDPSWRRHRDDGPSEGSHARAKAAHAPAVVVAPEDPYASAAPMDPYSDDDDVRVVQAPGEGGPAAGGAATIHPATPIHAGEGGVRTVVAPDPGAPAPRTVSASSAAGATAGVTTAAPAVAATAAAPAAPIAPAPALAGDPSANAPTSDTPAASLDTNVAVGSTDTSASVPAGPTDTSSSAAWSTAPVDPMAAAIAGMMTDTGTPPAPAATPKGATAPKSATGPKAAAKQPGVRSVSAATGATSTEAATAAAPAGAAVTGAIAADGATLIAKADVSAALGNFGALANAVRATFTPDGARLDAVASDSLFAKAGLRAGDTVTAINHQPLRSLDDAATLYARAGAMKSATIQILRGGHPLVLRLAIQ